MWAAETASQTSIPVWAYLVGILVPALFGLIAAIYGVKGHKEAKQANAAVNHKKPGQDRLFDMVADTHEKVKEIDAWKARWDDMPGEIDTADKLVTQFKVIEDRIDTSTELMSKRLTRLDTSTAVALNKLGDHLDTVESKIDSHVLWEMQQKWPVIETVITKETPE